MTIRTLNGEALTQLVLEVFRLNGELLGAGNRITGPFGLTSARWQVLGAIDEEGQPLTVSQIARRMGLARQGVQRIINDLLERDLVSSFPNIDHKRAPLFDLSKEGEKVMAKINAAQAAWVNNLSEALSAKEVSRALKLLRTISERLENSN
ncbi:MarR family transcriptional regulator [Pontixanthobacter sp. CEM42]|uniref:MarR family winged helix-turn-helix transcriptional regulator n=1 Tax=Pontixanthobacter sp. CEM42 TaxID=2792077 RepID=UPI001AE018F1|nr:MarR family transcriptional regulator [Pontixanthobacter sp. CEM42]